MKESKSIVLNNFYFLLNKLCWTRICILGEHTGDFKEPLPSTSYFAVMYNRNYVFQFVSVACRTHSLCVVLEFGGEEKRGLHSAAVRAATFAFPLSYGQVQVFFADCIRRRSVASQQKMFSYIISPALFCI